MKIKLQFYITLNGVINIEFGSICYQTKIRIHNSEANGTLKYDGETWILTEREPQRLEAVEVGFLLPLLDTICCSKIGIYCCSYGNSFATKRQQNVGGLITVKIEVNAAQRSETSLS
jgi:hypothetical protein